MRPLRVLVADAAPLQRAGLRAMLTTPTAAGEAPAAAAVPPAWAAAAQPPTPPAAAAQPPTPAAGAEPSAPGWPSDEPAPAEIVVAGEAGDGVEAVELARRLAPDVLITDLTLPRADGFAVARAVTRANLPVRVLVLTTRDSDDEILAAVAAGATGYLCKDAPREELVAAVRAVATGGAVIAPPLLARILGRVAEAVPVTTDNGAARLDALTGREREVLVHVARGRTNAEIADHLQVSETTVKTHVGHVLTKLRLRDRTQAVVLAYETGLVKPGA